MAVERFPILYNYIFFNHHILFVNHYIIFIISPPLHPYQFLTSSVSSTTSSVTAIPTSDNLDPDHDQSASRLYTPAPIWYVKYTISLRKFMINGTLLINRSLKPKSYQFFQTLQLSGSIDIFSTLIANEALQGELIDTALDSSVYLNYSIISGSVISARWYLKIETQLWLCRVCRIKYHRQQYSFG
jgi:hypothetical protein